MGKLKAASRNKKTPATKNTQSILKKQSKKKGDKRLSNSENKNDFKKSYATSEKHKSKQNSKKRKKHESGNILAVQDSTGPGTATSCSRVDGKTTKILPKIQANTKNEVKHRRRNKKQKQVTSPDQSNNNIVETDAFAIKKAKKLQVPAKETIASEEKEAKIKKIKIINQKKMEQTSTKKKTQQIEIEKILKLNKHKIKIKRLEEMFASKVQKKQTVREIKKQAPLTLRDRMMMHLKSSRFRFINETLYNNNGSQSNQYFKDDPDAFKAYHDGYKYQLEQWPVNPLNIIISSIRKMPTNNIIADFGCGEAQLAASVPHKVHSFDFIALNDRVEACDMARTPLLMDSVHVVVFCLSLMGINLNDYLMEANRVLKNNGILKIAEVESRFENIDDFIRLLGCYGFKSTWKDLSHNLFYFMDFKKVENITTVKRKNLPLVTLKPCLYKKR